VLVGTPGRLIDYLKQHVWSPKRVEVLVVDEADRMFDMGFISDLRFLLRRLPAPEKRQSFLFSATLSFRVLELTWEFMNNPAQITIMPQQKTADGVAQTLYHVGREDKFRLILGLLRQEGGERILIFCNTREEARRLEDRLTRNGWEARALTGDVEQRRRLRILNDFKEGKLPVLVASDVASRGLHIEAVSHVVNWDLPQDPEDYVHRIGRTARAGAEGKAISLVDEASALNLEAIEKFLGHKIAVEWPEDDLFVEEIKPSTEERRRFAEERRARIEARTRRDGRERGARGERPPRRERPLRPEESADRRREPTVPAAEPREPRVRFETVSVGDPLGPVAAGPPVPAPGGSGESPDSRRRRSRRRRRGSPPRGPAGA
jgi:ATP-dependent RNA helicase RhlB